MAGTQQSCAVLMLGAGGKLGRMVRASWAVTGFHVVPVVRSLPIPQGGLTWQPGAPAPDVGPVAAVVALWGVTPGPGRDLSENTALAVAAVDLAQAVGASAVLHCSSAAVYRPGPDPLTEDMAGDPPSPYGQAKLDMEQAIAARATPDGPRQIILRIGNVAGADSLFANLRPGAAVTLDRFADGAGPSRSYITAGDLARVIEGFLRSETGRGIYNTAAPVPTPMADLVTAVGADLNWRDAPEGAARQVWLDTGKLASVAELSQQAGTAQHLVSGAAVGGVWP
ncbi:NAD-dependent epimerase/dehydratase family protein [Antarctobacter jejuensis]|uniref:NAD-dependent epimerase/dehydratase family protein n=1 Tax=Antarctobacter jejuensis TaxID=1439938 RepID=UPI003FD1EA47